MNALEQLSLAAHALWITLRQVVHASLWLPWLLLGALQMVVVGALWWFAHPLLSWFMAPWLESVAGPAALRYPAVFQLMPALFARADLWLGALAGSIALGASTLLFAERYRGALLPPWAGLREAWRRGWMLVLVNLPLHALAFGLSIGIDAWLESRGSGAMVQRLAQAAGFGAVVLLQAAFLYVNALVMLGGQSPWGAWAGIASALRRGGWAALGLALVAVLPLLPAPFLARASAVVVERGAPEIAGLLVIAQIVLGLATAFLATGGTTLAYQALLEEEDQPDVLP